MSPHAEKYLKQFRETHDRENTVRNNTDGVLRFEKWLGARMITPETLTDFKLWTIRKSASIGTRNLWLQTAGSFVRWLAQHGYIPLDTSLLQRLLKPFPSDRSLVELPTPLQIRRLVIFAGQWRGGYPLGALVLAGMLTGARRSELTNMHVTQHIDTVNQKLILVSTKTRREREFPLAVCGVGAKLFHELHRLKSRLAWDFRAWDVLRVKAEAKNVEFKQFRAMFSSYGKSAGANPWLINKWLAHSEKTAEQFYDRALVGIKGENLPQWLGLEAEFAEAVEICQITRG